MEESSSDLWFFILMGYLGLVGLQSDMTKRLTEISKQLEDLRKDLLGEKNKPEVEPQKDSNGKYWWSRESTSS